MLVGLPRDFSWQSLLDWIGLKVGCTNYRNLKQTWPCCELILLHQISKITFMCLISATTMSWVRVWVDLDLFITQFLDKVLLDKRKLKECE